MLTSTKPWCSRLISTWFATRGSVKKDWRYSIWNRLADHERQARQFLDATEEIGANLFDHANIYGRGRCEEVFGRVLRERPSLRDKIVIQSKCGIRWADDPPGTPQRFDFSRDHIFWLETPK